MNVVRKVVRVCAEIVLTLGLIGLLLCVHQLWWTNREARADARDRIHDIRDLWAEESATPAPGDSPLPGPTDIPEPTVYDTGEDGNVGVDGEADGTVPKGATTKRGATLALLYIPRLGKNYVQPIVEGTSGKSLKQGVGHYTTQPYTPPGGRGNFGLAAHRNGGGEPFRFLNHLKAGDAVVVETATHWYTYRVIQGPYITNPDEGSVVWARPPQLEGRGGDHLLTMTTCDPEWSSRNRMIYWGTLDAVDAKRDGYRPAALRG